jgi:hypothetical protein
VSRRRRRFAAALALVLLCGACTGGAIQVGPAVSRAAPVPLSPEPHPSGGGAGPSSSEATLERLCPKARASSPPPAQPAEGGPPAAIAQIEREVESVRGLKFKTEVPVDPISQQQMAHRLQQSLDRSLPEGYLARRSQAWQAIGAIPQGAEIRPALLRFLTGNVIGFYQPSNKQLVFVGSSTPSSLEQLTLAHELTHAIDDQHFDLTRVDSLQNSCMDEAGSAALATIEGSAQFFSFQVARRYFSLSDLGGLLQQSVPSLQGVPPFIVQMEVWPYIGGLQFVMTLDARGGTAAVNDAIRHLPTSTEQVIHPERYPNDQPQTVTVPDLGPKLGRGWHDLDVEQVGEEWLSALLALRLDQTTAGVAASGWDGGLARSWADGRNTAVELSTVWDTTNDAEEFAAAMRTWSSGSIGSVSVEPPDGASVRVLFASDAPTLQRLSAAGG